MNNYHYEIYEDKFAIYLCVILSKGIVNECVCIQRIRKDMGACEDGTFGSLCDELAEYSEAWKDWKHSELAPGLMYLREIAINYTLIATSVDATKWSHLGMSEEARALISTECSECKVGGGDDV